MQFLSPDNHIQEGDNPQNYNRYGYCLNNPLLYTDPSGEIFGIDDVIISGLIIGAIIGAGTYMIQAVVTGNWSWGGFAKSVFIGALTGAITGSLSNAIQLGETISFWEAVGMGALNGSVSGGISSAANGQNFFAGFAMGAITGAVMGGIVHEVGKLFSKKTIEYHEMEAEGNKIPAPEGSAPLTTADAKETWNKNWKPAYNSTDNTQQTYLMKKGSVPKGYTVNNETGTFINGEGKEVLGVTETISRNGKVAYNRIYTSNAAYTSKAQLNYVFNHEFGHVVLNNNYGLASSINQVINKSPELALVDTEAHVSIQYMGRKFLQLNSWTLNTGNVFNGFFTGGATVSNRIFKFLEPLIIKIK